jgi:hypothetical protein
MSATATPGASNKSLGRHLFTERRLAKLLAILMPVILGTSVQPTSVKAQADNATVKFSDSFAFTFFNTCTGEDVSGVVNVQTTVHVSPDSNGGFHAHIHNVFNGRAVGETSGIEYVGPQTDHDSFNESSGGIVEETATVNFRFLSRGGADNILTHLLFHITVSPDGVVKIEIENITSECRG